MMNRLDEDAQEALQLAQQIMFRKQQQQLDVEHIFLALLTGHFKGVTKIIESLGGDMQAMANRINTALDKAQNFGFVKGSATGYITSRAQRVLQGAALESDRLDDRKISTVHLLLAIAAERSGSVVRILQEEGINHDKILAAANEMSGDREKAEAYSSEARERTTGELLQRAIINPESLAEPRGFNHGVLTSGGRLLFLGGQTALDKEGNIVAPGDIVAQYRQVLSNLDAVLEEAGGRLEDIVKMTIFVSDRDDYKAHLKELGNVHKEFFGKYYPATALLEISKFFDDEAMIEIEGIAVIE